MKVLVIGAGGKTGRLVVERAVAAGHNVVALVHSSKDLEKHPLAVGARVREADVRNPTDLEVAMDGCEGVIDALGGKTPYMETTLETDAARVVLATMEKVGARRLVVISVMGAGESKEQAGWLYEHLLMPVFLRGAMKDKNAMETEVRESAVEWVLVRPPMLSDSEATGALHVVPEIEKAQKITRGDLAQFLVDQLESDEYVGQAITVADS